MEVKKSKKKNVKFTTIAWVMAIMLLVIIIPLNIVVSLFDVQFDLTQNKMYSLTQTTRDYLSSLDKAGTKVDMYLLCDMDEVREEQELLALSKTLDAIQEYDCINFKDVDPDTNPKIKEELNPDGYLQLSTGDIVVRCGDNIKRVYGNSTYSYDYDENGVATTEYFVGENVITGAIKSVVEGEIPSVYFLTGHGEKSIENDYTQFRKNLKNYNYDAKELNLTTAEAVPDDAAIIIVAAPQTDISDAEKEKIEDFMDKGGNLSLLMSP
ncbi:MAG: Gldg family protein, partial [Porcipelethomonas sp.]